MILIQGKWRNVLISHHHHYYLTVVFIFYAGLTTQHELVSQSAELSSNLCFDGFYCSMPFLISTILQIVLSAPYVAQIKANIRWTTTSAFLHGNKDQCFLRGTRAFYITQAPVSVLLRGTSVSAFYWYQNQCILRGINVSVGHVLVRPKDVFVLFYSP